MTSFLFLSLLIFTTITYSQQQIDIPWPTLADSPWPMIGHDPQITGRSPYSGPKLANIKWTLDLPYGVYSGPIIGEDGTLYVGTRAYLYFTGDTTNYFYAIKADGQIKWTFLTGNPNANESGYLINNEGAIFFGSQSGWLYAIDTSGKLQWKYDTGGNIFQMIMNTDLNGNLYIANNTQNLFSISKNGDLNWEVNFGGGFHARSVTISPDGNSLYISGRDSNIYSLNLDGSVKWVYNCWGISAPLTVDNSGNIYFLPGSKQRTLVSLDSTGNLNWEYPINNGNAFNMDSSPAIDYYGNIYFIYAAQDSSLDYCRLESVDYYGNYRWTYQFEQPFELIVMPLIIDNGGTVYCGSTWGHFFYAISGEGELLWKLPLNGYQVDNSGAIDSDGTLYIGTHLNSLHTTGEKTLIAVRDTVTSVNNNPETLRYYLEQNYPNPFNSRTHIKYSIPQAGRVTLKVYDLLGNEVAHLLDRFQESGEYDVIFQPESLSSGIYFYRLYANDYITTKKFILLK